MNSTNRLEAALAAYLRYQQEGSDWQQLLAKHPDLADLLEAFRDEAPVTTSAAGEAPAELGDYRLDCELGRGGSGVVHRAVDRRLGRTVAIKLLHRDYADQPTTVARFLREAQLLARLDHRGIVQVLDVGSHEGRPWLAMEFVDGPSLAQRIARQNSEGGHVGDSLRELVEAIAQVAEALAHAHKASIVHRDVKPSNVLLRADGAAVLTDFGIARDAQDPSLTQTGVVVGSPHYLAPEQALGDAAQQSASVDVFALGATLYECITLRRAFDGTSVQAVVQAVLYQDPEDPQKRQRGVPHDLVAIVMKALEKDPAHRYSTAAAFAEDLRAFLELREVTARTTTGLTRWLRRARRNPVLGATAGLGLALLVVLGWLALQWPSLAAAKDAERLRAYEAETTTGFLTMRRGAEVGREHFQRAYDLAPDRAEAVIGLALAASRAGGGAPAALATLDSRSRAVPDTDAARALSRVRVWLLGMVQRQDDAAALEASLPPPRSALELWARSLVLSMDPTPANLSEARSLLSLAVRTAPQANLLLHAQWARLVVASGGVDERREAAEALLRQWPTQPVALHLAGVALLTQAPERAVELLREALQRGESDPLCLVNLGIAEASAGELAAGVVTLRRAFEARLEDGERVQVLNVLGQLQANETADELAELWLQRDDASPEAWRHGARAAFRREEPELALQRIARSLELRPGDVEACLDLVLMLRRTGDRSRERAELEALVQANPRHDRIHRQLADAVRLLGDRPALLAELRRWTNIQPDDDDNWRELAEQLLLDADEAVLNEALAAAERLDYLNRGTDGSALQLRARILDQLGDPSEATRLRRRASTLPPR